MVMHVIVGVGMHQGRTWAIFCTITLFTLGLAALTFMLPVAGTVENAAAEHSRTALATITAGWAVGAAIWMLAGARGFKSGLRSAYNMLAIGIILIGVSLMQLPIAGLYDLWDTPWLASGGAIVPFIVSGMLVYAGARKFAKLLEIKQRITSFWFVLGVTAGAAVLSAVLAYFLVIYEMEGVETYIATVVFAACFLMFSALAVRAIKNTIGEDYRPAMNSLMIAMAAWAFGAFYEAFFTFFINNGDFIVDYGIYLWPFMLAALLLVFAARRFYMMVQGLISGASVDDFHGATQDSDYIESISNISIMASHPREIDPMLDDLRKITAVHANGQPLTDTERQRLLDVYHKLEAYLEGSDPLRTFTKEEIRRRATPAFRAALEKA
jgi:hypothetical protein